MENSKPYLAIYNAKNKVSIENIDFDDFQVEFFTQPVFSQDISKAIVNKVAPNQIIVVIKAQAEFPRFWFERLDQVLIEKPQAQVCSALTSKKSQLSPLAAGDKFNGSTTELDNLIYLLQKAGAVYSDEINDECFIVRNLNTLIKLDEALYHACNNLFVQECAQGYIALSNVYDIGNQKRLPAHPLATLQWQLKSYLDGSNTPNKYPLLDGKPILLHITMGWGGGIHQWIDDFSRHENQYHHLILCSDGELYRQAHGENLTLHYQQTNGLVMRRNELQAPIKATCISHGEYKQILDKIITDFQVQQVVVSSLIGHSMECLQTGVTTLRVLHDYFPSWPSLIAHLDKDDLTDKDLEQALAQTKKEPFGEIPEEKYLSWRDELHKIYQKDLVSLVAPNQSVVDNLSKIDASAFKQVTVIPHAISKFQPINYTANKKKFQILVLGRINPPKGQKLLEGIIEKLGKGYYFAFIGAGNEGKKYLPEKNVSVIMDYKNAELAGLLQEAQADIALITSQTSETFNYTLSELQQAGICTVSTKYGALKNRIVDGETGFLCEDNVDAMVERIRDLKSDTNKIITVHKKLLNKNLPVFEKIVAEYLCYFSPAKKTKYRLQKTHTDSNILAKNLHHLDEEKQRVEALLASTELTLEERTKWGKKLTNELKKAAKDIALERKESKHLKGVIKKESARMMLEIRVLKRTHEKKLLSIYQSRSWRVTKPLRQTTTWTRHKRNALKFRLAQMKTLPSRATRSLKTRGLKSTLGVIKGKLNKDQTSAKRVKEIELTTDFVKLNLKTINNPDVSIIIPVYNHFEHTYNCLKSIASLAEKTTFEVVVIDDCSTDDTQKLIKKVSGIIYKRQKQNGGFIEACNTGAKLATGKYLMFLNNDTVVHDNWLDALLDVFASYTDAGLVGSKLVYPDNQLQEAGGIVFSDGSGWNYGRLGNPDEPCYNHVREVDYCSGASILISQKLFTELGCFDERYKPAYYEDTDLAFAVRNVGKKVYYQPASKVTHFEGITSGTDLTAGMKKYQVVNQTKFKEKWAKQLTKQPQSGTDIELCRIHGQPKRFLIFDACTPTPDQDSGSLRMLNIIKILKELNYHIIFIPENLSYNGGYSQELQQLGVECIYTPSFNNPVDYLKNNGKYLDVVMMSRYYVAQQVVPFIREYCPKAQVIFDTVDLHYVRELRMAELGDDNKLFKMAAVTKEKELAVAKVCDVTLVVSPYEVEVLAQDAPDVEVKVLSNIHEIYGCRNPFKQRKDIMFIGGYQHTPNIDAVQWFVKEIFPLIIKELPGLKFHIIGSKAPKQIQEMANENIIFQGFIEEIETYMDDVRIAVAPLRFGAGVKGKVNMSMSYGQPVVGTKIAVEGMFTIDEKDCLMAETSEEFAKQVIRLYQNENLWNTISKGGLANVQSYFSFAAAKQSIKTILKELN